MKLTLGCTTRPFQVPFAEACQRIAAAGYTDVAVFGAVVGADSNREEALAARQAALDAGLAPSMLLARAQLDLGLDEAVAKYRQLIDNAVTLGADWLLELGMGTSIYRGVRLDARIWSEQTRAQGYIATPEERVAEEFRRHYAALDRVERETPAPPFHSQPPGPPGWGAWRSRPQRPRRQRC